MYSNSNNNISPSTQPYNYSLKLILVGDSSVGKTSLLNRFLSGTFDQYNQFTIGVEFGQKIVAVNRNLIKLQVWDTAGQQQFRSMTRSYYRSSAAALVVFDVTRLQSYRNAKRWVEDVKTNGHKDIILVLVGNKIDLSMNRQVSRNEALRLATEYRMIYIQTSAKSQENVQECFIRPAVEIVSRIENGVIEVGKEENGIKVRRAQNTGKINKGCCEC